MVQIINQQAPASMRLAETLGHTLGKGLGEFATSYYSNKALEKVLNDPELKNADPSERMGALERALQPFGEAGKDIFQRRLQGEQLLQGEKNAKIRAAAEEKKNKAVQTEADRNYELKQRKLESDLEERADKKKLLGSFLEPKERDQETSRSESPSLENPRKPKRDLIEELEPSKNVLSEPEPSRDNLPEIASKWSKLTPEEQVALAAYYPQVARTLQDADKQQENISQKKREADLKVALAKDKETFPIRKNLAEKAEAARGGIENKERLIELIDKGDINDPTYATLAQALPLSLGKRLLSPDTVVYKAGLVDEFKDLRTIFQGQTRVKEIEVLEQKIADLYLNDDQKRAILGSRINALKADIIRSEAASEIEQEGKHYGILEFEKEIAKRAKPRLDALFNRILDEQNAIIKDAEHKKATPLDPRDPEDKKISDQIFKEAGGNVMKAREIAKKKGYKLS